MLEQVGDERGRQDAKWGEQNHPDGTPGQAHRMFADIARHNCDRAAERGEVTWTDILNEEFNELLAESDPAEVRAEAIQVAAVAVAWVEAIDRRTA